MRISYRMKEKREERRGGADYEKCRKKKSASEEEKKNIKGRNRKGSPYLYESLSFFFADREKKQKIFF
jgi:hypothetical protein